MKTLFWLVLACAGLAACGSEKTPPLAEKADSDAANAPAPAAPRTVRVYVDWFEDRNGERSPTEYFSTGLTVFLTARLEELSNDPAAIKAAAGAGFALETVIGTHVVPEGSGKLLLPLGSQTDLRALHAAAKKAGATHALAGYYAGRVEWWSVGIVLFEVRPDRLEELARSASEGKIYASSRDVPKPARPGVQLGVVHAMLGEAVAQAFASARIGLPPPHVKALSMPQTEDVVSFINLARAYRALLAEPEEEGMKKALALSENAVRIWPNYQLARRLYAWLLWQIDRPEKARLHFQEALKLDPNDVRARIALGRLEIGTEQFDSAREQLEAATRLRPKDPLVQYWLGVAYAKLGQADEAIRRYETSRAIDPSNIETRRALAGLYAAARRYADAAAELEAVTEREPKNFDALAMLAACHRADGRLDKALAAYDIGLSRMPGDARLVKLRKDVSAGVGAHWSAYIAETDALRAKMETARAEFQDAVNDGTWLLSHLKKEEACADGFAGSDYLFAKATGNDRYEAAGKEFQRRTAELRAAFKEGARLALTPDENGRADDVLRYEQKALRDYREMRTAFSDTFKPMLARAGCETDPAKIRVAKIEDIRARNERRDVTLPEPPRRDGSGISPVVPSGAVDHVTFYVQNDTSSEIVLVLDGRAIEPSVPPLKKGAAPARYSAPIGQHALCHVPKGAKAECAGTNVRSFLIDEGLIYHVQTR